MNQKVYFVIEPKMVAGVDKILFQSAAGSKLQAIISYTRKMYAHMVWPKDSSEYQKFAIDLWREKFKPIGYKTVGFELIPLAIKVSKTRNGSEL